MAPAFGALPKIEVELIFLEALIQLGVIDDEPKVYDLVSTLHITRSRARNLIYERELRRSTTEVLDEKVRELLCNPLIQKNRQYLLEIDNPLVSDHLRDKVQKLGYITDGSFSPNIVKLGLDAISALIESYLSQDEQKQIQDIIISAGARIKRTQPLQEIIKYVLDVALSKSTDVINSDIGVKIINSIFKTGAKTLSRLVSELFKGDE